MPEVGEVRTGIDFGRSYHSKFIWAACQDCGKERWVKLANGKPAHIRCNVCASKLKQITSHTCDWRQGTVYQNGYVSVRLDKADFFYPMARRTGYVFEHRLVMAKHLGRYLHSWEIVHHKNHVRDDNRLENLQLVSDDRHNQITILERRVAYLEQRVTLLEAENTLLKEVDKCP